MYSITLIPRAERGGIGIVSWRNPATGEWRMSGWNKAEMENIPNNPKGYLPGTWSVEAAQTPFPESTTILLLGAGFVGLARFGRKKFKK